MMRRDLAPISTPAQPVPVYVHETFAAYSRVRVTLDARRGPLTRPTF